MISKKIVLILTLVTGLCMFAFVRTAASTVATSHCCQTSDSYGAGKTTFGPSENVYVNGNGFPTCATLNIYVVCHQATWNDGETIPSRIAGTATSVTTDANGNIPTAIVWTHNLVPGSYDIVVDANCNGKYDKSIDGLDASLGVNAGFFVIPEYVLGAILGLAGFFAAYGVFRLSKTRSAKNLVKKN